MRPLIASLPFVLAVLPANASAQDAPSANRAGFDQAFAEYKATIGQIEALKIEFQTADADGREAINQQVRDLIRSAQPQVNKMVQEALKVYKADPEADEQVTDLLLGVAGHKLMGSGKKSQGGDQFEQSLEVVQALLDGGNKTPGLPAMGVVAAFCTNNYDLAAKYAALAQERGDDTSRLGEDFQGMVAQYSDPAMLQEYSQLWAKEKAIREAEAKADDLPRVKFQTSKGDIVLELFENEAPNAVGNMISLVKKGFYDGVVFHRVLPHFMAQGGDPDGVGTGGPGYTIPCECQQENARMHFRGSLSMAHAGRDTGGLAVLPDLRSHPAPQRQAHGLRPGDRGDGCPGRTPADRSGRAGRRAGQDPQGDGPPGPGARLPLQEAPRAVIREPAEVDRVAPVWLL